VITGLLGIDDDIANVGMPEQQVIAGEFDLVLVDTAAHGGIALRVEIDQQHAATGIRQRRCQVNAGRGLANATLLVGHCDYMNHIYPALVLYCRMHDDQVPFGIQSRYLQCHDVIDDRLVLETFHLGHGVDTLHGQHSAFVITEARGVAVKIR